MGVRITHMNSVFNRDNNFSNTVVNLATNAITPILQNGAPKDFSHVVVATTCPDTLAPTLGQSLVQLFYPRFATSHVLDLVQGCAGGLSAMVLATQLCELNRQNIAVVLADAARQSVSDDNNLRQYFGNGAFSCVVEYTDGPQRLIYHRTKQYKNLSELVVVRLGHRTHHEILAKQKRILHGPLDHLGLHMNPILAVKLLRHAEEFYCEFLKESNTRPDIMIFHQVNPEILNILEGMFVKYADEFINLGALIGNCGAASFAIAMDQIKGRLPGKKVFLCSFGTGGVISAGLWQF